MLIYCIIAVLLVSYLYGWGAKSASTSGVYYLKKNTILLGMAIFTLWVGLRYNMKSDPDFDGYWDMVETGSSNFYYDHLEIIPRLCIDLVYKAKLPTSTWFIMMGAFLTLFTTIAARRHNGKYLQLLFLSYILLYLTFDMNVVRQGVALSAMLCAFTYISEKKWKNYLFFAFLAFCFHRSSIIWTPLYFLTYLDWHKNVTKKYVLAILIIAIIMSFLLYFMSMFTFVFNIMQVTDRVQYRISGGVIDDNDIVKVKSGFGIVFRYIRWFFMCGYIPLIIKNMPYKKELRILFTIFLLGMAMDIFSMFEIGLARVALYPQIVEILLLPYLIEYCNLRKRGSILLMLVLLFQIIILGYQLGLYFSDWEIVNFKNF